jgi:hypothetical protein
MSNALNIPQMVEGQASPEVTVNDATAALGDALANKFDCNLTAGNVAVTAAQYRAAILFRAINVATSGRTVTLPAVERELVLVECDSANTNTVALIVGSTTVVMTPGRLYVVRTDGTTNGLVARDVGGISEPRDASVFIPGLMTNNQLLYRTKATRAFTWPANLVGSNITSNVAATASTVILIKNNGTTIATITFAISGTVATFVTTGGTAKSIAVGDVVTIVGPATADTTLADVTLDLFGSR